MRRTILKFACVMSGASIILTALLIRFTVVREFTERLKLEVETDAYYISRAVESIGAGYVISLPSDASNPRVTLIDAAGRVTRDTWANSGLMELHLDRPEVKAAMSDGTGEATRYSDTLGRRMYYYAVRLGDGSVLRVAGAIDGAMAGLPRLALITLGIAAAVFAASAAIGSRVTRAIVAPINRLNLEAPEENAIYEEIAPLLARLNVQNGRLDEQVAEMRRQQAEFSAITENMREGLLVIDRDGRVLSRNTSALAMLGAPTGSAENLNALELASGGSFREVIDEALGGELTELTVTLRGRRVGVFANPVFEGGVVQGAVILLLDVTEREDRERMRREFSANVSHELKTPLTAISGYAEILANGVAKPEDAPGFGAKIYQEARGLIALVGDIMLVSRLDEGGVEPIVETVDLYALVSGVAARFEEAAARRGVTIALRGGTEEIVGDRHLLEEITGNLIDNAVKYNKDSGSVNITVGRSIGGKVELTVADTGIGVPSQERERVFERFYRTNKGRAHAVGTGLGLSIVKHAAMAHNAVIELQSDGETGTRVKVIFQGEKRSN
jgi:two-component system phosphate regulon sensor histidine kinase PhoR